MEDIGRKVDKSQNKDQAAMQEQLSHGIKKENSREDFQNYFLNKDNFNKLCDDCINGDMKTLRCRWTAWRAFLGLLPVGDEAKMREEVKKQRKFYAGEYEKFMNFRGKAKLSAEVDNPLSTASSNPWNSFYGDSELKDEIKKDIERTYQDLEFFVTKPAQTLLTNVLFIWSKQNPDLSYRQGMNEIAAVLTYACFTENYKPEKPQTDIYDFLNDQEFAEADIYTAFKRILELDQKNMFVVTQPLGKNGKPIKKKDDAPNRPNLPVVHRAVYIQEELLPKVHEELFAHYQALQVEPHIYLMRWLRCMLVREFNIQQAFCVWDAVFAHHIRHTPTSKKFEMMDYLCVAMMISISQLLLDIDNGGMLLGKLLKYPPVDNVHFLIKNCQTGVLDVLNSEEGKEKQAPSKLLTIAKEEEKKPAVVPAKKVVLFNPSVPILSSKEVKETSPEAKGTKEKIQSPLSSEPLANTKPTSPKNTQKEEPPKKPEPTVVKNDKPSVPSKIFESKAAAEKTTTSSTSSDFKINTQKPNPFGAAPVKKLETKTVAETSDGPLILFSKSSSTTEKKEQPALFKPSASSSKPTEQKDSPLAESPEKKKTVSTFNNNNNDILGSTNTQKEYQEQIKKLQNAIKLVKIENEKNVSMGINEALDDMNDVLKFLRKQIQ